MRLCFDCRNLAADSLFIIIYCFYLILKMMRITALNKTDCYETDDELDCVTKEAEVKIEQSII